MVVDQAFEGGACLVAENAKPRKPSTFVRGP